MGAVPFVALPARDVKMAHSPEVSGGVAQHRSPVLAVVRATLVTLLFCVGFVIAFEASAHLLLPDLVASARARTFAIGVRRARVVVERGAENFPLPFAHAALESA